MKRLFLMLFLLPSLGACTIENDYYTGYRQPPPRVRIETPYSPVHRYYREVPKSRIHRSHDRRRNVIVPVRPRYVKPNTNEHGHDNGRGQSGPGRNNPVHGHD